MTCPIFGMTASYGGVERFDSTDNVQGVWRNAAGLRRLRTGARPPPVRHPRAH